MGLLVDLRSWAIVTAFRAQGVMVQSAELTVPRKKMSLYSEEEMSAWS